MIASKPREDRGHEKKRKTAADRNEEDNRCLLAFESTRLQPLLNY
jgi:hypothetical protein